MPSINLGTSPVVAGQGLVFSGASLNVNVANSIIITGDQLQLVGDQGAPGISRYYGTNAAGTKGWYVSTEDSVGVATINNISGSLSIVGTGTVSVTTVGQTIYVSGVSGGVGDATQSQLNAISGFFLTPPQIDLAGSAILRVNTNYYDDFGSNRNLVFTGTPSGGSTIKLRANVTGLTVLGVPTGYRIGDEGITTGISLAPGNHEISWVYADDKWWMADTAGLIDNLDAARGPSSIDDRRSGYAPGSQWFDTTVSGYYVCLNANTSGAVWYRVNNPTGIFTSSIVLNGQTLTTTGSNLYINGSLISGGGAGGTGNYTALTVTGSSVLSSAQLTGVGTVVVTQAGSNVMVSGITRPALSPGFAYATGGVVDITVDPNKTSQRAQITATGNVILNLNGTYDGCNGSIVIYKTYGGTGSVTLPSNSYIINGGSSFTNVMPLSTGASGYDVASFIYSVTRPYWAVSTLSGSASSVAGSFTGVTSVNSAQADVNITGAGTATVTRVGQVITVSGASNTALLAPAFNYYTGGVVTISGDASRAAQNARITATGNIILRLTGVYDGMNGVVAITKNYAGTGSVTLSSNSYIVNAPDVTVLPLSTGSGIIDAIAFIHDDTRPIWTVSTLSGFAEVSIGGGSGTSVTITGSSTLAGANFIGVGGTLVWRSGLSTVVVSGGVGAGTVTQGQLDSVSGFFLTPPQVNLAGGTTLNVNTNYYDGFGGNRSLSFGGSPSAGSFVTLRANVTGYSVLAIPSSYRIGQTSTVTGLSFAPGNHEVSWIYADSKWWMADSAGAVSELSATRGPTTTDDQRSGYSAGASYWLDESVSGLYVNLKATTSGAAWYRINNPTGLFETVGIGTVNPSYRLDVSGSGQIVQFTTLGISGLMTLTNLSASANNTSANIVLGNNDGAALAAGDRMGAIVFAGNNGGGPAATSNVALIGVYADQNWVSGAAYGTRIDFDLIRNGSIARGTVANISSTGLTVLGSGVFNANGSPITPTTAGSCGIHVAGPEGVRSAILNDSFGEASLIVLRRANGTAISKTTVLANDQIGVVTAHGYRGTGYGDGGGGFIDFVAAENWTSSGMGTNARIILVPTGSTAQSKSFYFTNQENLGIGTSSFGNSAARVISMATATPPTSSPAGVGQLYVVSGALVYRGSGGTVTVIGPA